MKKKSYLTLIAHNFIKNHNISHQNQILEAEIALSNDIIVKFF